MYDQQQREADIYRQQQEQQIQMQMWVRKPQHICEPFACRQQQQLYEEQQRMMQQQEESSMSMSSMQQQQVTSSSSSMRQEQSSSSSMRQEQHSSSSMQQETKQETRVVKQVLSALKKWLLVFFIPGGAGGEEARGDVWRRVQAGPEDEEAGGRGSGGGEADSGSPEGGQDEEASPTRASPTQGDHHGLFLPLFSLQTNPKEINVVAGDGKTVKLVLGGENELEDCRKQVERNWTYFISSSSSFP